METVDKSNNLNVSKHLNSLEGAQWGKPGPGGSYWRQSALTGQGFHEKMVRTTFYLFSLIPYLLSLILNPLSLNLLGSSGNQIEQSVSL